MQSRLSRRCAGRRGRCVEELGSSWQHVRKGAESVGRERPEEILRIDHPTYWHAPPGPFYRKWMVGDSLWLMPVNYDGSVFFGSLWSMVLIVLWM